MIDRTVYAAQGIEAAAGAPGAFTINDQPGTPKTVVWFEPDARVRLSPPGGAGYGPPRQRDPQAVLQDVIDGYISVEAAAREYGVRVRYTGPQDAWSNGRNGGAWKARRERSIGRAAAADVKHRPGRKRAFVRGQPRHQRRYFGWLTRPAESEFSPPSQPQPRV